MFSTELANKKEASQLVSTPSESMAAQLDIQTIGETDVSAIDTSAQSIQTSQGAISYGKLVLALGADQIRLPLQGEAANEVLTVNDLEDYILFRKCNGCINYNTKEITNILVIQ